MGMWVQIVHLLVRMVTEKKVYNTNYVMIFSIKHCIYYLFLSFSDLSSFINELCTTIK